MGIRSSLAGSISRRYWFAGVFRRWWLAAEAKKGLHHLLPRYHNPSRPDALPVEWKPLKG